MRVLALPLALLAGACATPPPPAAFQDPAPRQDPPPAPAAPAPQAAAAVGTSLLRPPMAADEEEARILDVLADMRRHRAGHMNVPEEDGRLLRLLVETIGARKAVEIGTSNGYSAIWMCLGLRRTGGHLKTHEIDPRRAALARGNFQSAGVAHLVTIVEGDAHETVKELREPIDLLFLDADKEGYLAYLQKLRGLVRPGGLIVAHNMRRPPPDPVFVHAVTTDPELETLFFHMDAAGIAVTLKKR